MADEEEVVQTINAGEVGVRVEKVHVDGVGRTRDDVLTDNTYVREVLEASTLQEAIFKAILAKEHFDRLGIFRKCKILIDTSKGPHASTNGIEVVFTCKEFRSLGGGVGTTINSSNEPSIKTDLRMPNMFGRAEKLHLEYSYGSKKTQNFQVAFVKPVFRNLESRWSVGGYQGMSEHPWSEYKQTDRGVFTSLRWPTLTPVPVVHQVQWDVVWREMACLTHRAPFTIREECGHTLKEALKYSITYDTRESQVMPLSGGWMWRLSHELAGAALGDVSHLKTGVELQTNLPLPWDSLAQLNLGLGQVSSPGAPRSRPGTTSGTRIIDNYFLGGPLTFRGFELNSVGPTSASGAPVPVGGNTFWNLGLHLYTPLPFRPGRGGFGDLFKTHAFLHAGNLRNMSIYGSDSAEIGKLFSSSEVRSSCGVGLLFILGGVVRLEVNYCHPLTHQASDRIVSGLQFGIGASYI